MENRAPRARRRFRLKTYRTLLHQAGIAADRKLFNARDGRKTRGDAQAVKRRYADLLVHGCLESAAC